MKYLIFDSGTLINLSMNGLLEILEKLKKDCSCKMLITPAVKFEIIDRPLGIQRFELGALKIQKMISSGTLSLSDEVVNPTEIKNETQILLEKANHMIKVKDTWVNLVSEAEISCLALSRILENQGHKTLIAIDERTTRTICENPGTLEQLMSSKLHQRAILENYEENLFKNFKFVRSSELVYVAYKKGVLGIEGKKALEAALYATKYKGASISFEEINEIKKMQ